MAAAQAESKSDEELLGSIRVLQHRQHLQQTKLRALQVQVDTTFA